ncbi:MAG: hypothetical protein ACJA1A_003594 [Saprospiraceae bacterium]|jgi:hypothetical protein
MYVEAYVDGSYRPQGSAAAIIIYEGGEEVYSSCKPVIANNSSTPELEAILLAVNVCFSMLYPSPVIFTDSKVSEQQFYHKSGISERETLMYMDCLWEIHKIYPFQIKYTKRINVTVPDRMCKEFLLSIDKKYKLI